MDIWSLPEKAYPAKFNTSQTNESVGKQNALTYRTSLLQHEVLPQKNLKLMKELHDVDLPQAVLPKSSSLYAYPKTTQHNCLTLSETRDCIFTHFYFH